MVTAVDSIVGIAKIACPVTELMDDAHHVLRDTEALPVQKVNCINFLFL